MSDLYEGRSAQLDRALADLLRRTPEIEAASVVSFDGLPMASALPPSMDENRVAAMSASLLSLGERAAEGLGRGELSQVYVEGETGTVFLVSAEDEAVLVAVGAPGAKVGLLLYEIRHAASVIGGALRRMDAELAEVVAEPPAEPAAFVEEPQVAQVAEAEVAEAEVAEAEVAEADLVTTVSAIEVPMDVPTELPGGAAQSADLEIAEPVVDEADPLGLGDVSDPVASDGSDGSDGSDAAEVSDDSDPDGWSRHRSDLGSWMSYSPGSSDNDWS